MRVRMLIVLLLLLAAGCKQEVETKPVNKVKLGTDKPRAADARPKPMLDQVRDQP